MGTSDFFTPAGVKAFVIYSIAVKYNASPVASLMEVGAWPLFSPLNPCCLKILTIASNDPEYTLSTADLWIWILIRVCSMGLFVLNIKYHKEWVQRTSQKGTQTLLSSTELSCIFQSTVLGHCFLEVFIESEPDRSQNTDTDKRSKTA